MPPMVTAVIEAVPALVLSSQLMETTEIRLGLAPPVPCAVKVMVVPDEVLQALLTGITMESANGSQPAGTGVVKVSNVARRYLSNFIRTYSLHPNRLVLRIPKCRFRE